MTLKTPEFKNTPFYEVLQKLMALQATMDLWKVRLPDTVIIGRTPARYHMHRQKNKRYPDGRVPIYRGRDLQTLKKLEAARERAASGRWTGYSQLDIKL